MNDNHLSEQQLTDIVVTWLRQAMVGVTAVSLEQKAGVSRQTISAILNRRTKPDLITVGRLARALRIQLPVVYDMTVASQLRSASAEIARMAALLDESGADIDVRTRDPIDERQALEVEAAAQAELGRRKGARQSPGQGGGSA